MYFHHGLLGLLDRKEVRRYLETTGQREWEDKIYGIDRGTLETKGPSVSPINGVVASLAATEFMAAATGPTKPHTPAGVSGLAV